MQDRTPKGLTQSQQKGAKMVATRKGGGRMSERKGVHIELLPAIPRGTRRNRQPAISPDYLGK
jgi:hypothetical protein